jgi:NADPH-dependent 2,4-dienoyl-CoA reductase/sulfur reductase-like enzyme
MGKTPDLRISDHPGRRFGRGESLNINFENTCIKAFSSEPVAVALLAAGLKTFSRSMKFHRPRGVFSLSSVDGNSLLRIDGVSNTPSGRVLCRDGMRVERETGFPATSFDLLSVADIMFPKKFDYHGMFTGSKILNRGFRSVVRSLSGLGELPDFIPADRPQIRDIETDIMVAGGGPAGMTAALEAADAGLSVLLVDNDVKPGGHLLGFMESVQEFETGTEWARHHEELINGSNIQFMPESEVIGYYSEGFFVLRDPRGLTRVQAKQHILACGAHEQILPFANNDLPGIFGAGSLSTLVARYGVRAGSKAVIIGCGPFARSLADRLDEFNIDVACIATQKQQSEASPESMDSLEQKGVQVLHGFHIAQASGRQKLEGVKITGPDSRNAFSVKCDILAVDAPLAPCYELARQAGAHVGYDKEIGAFRPRIDNFGRTSAEGIYVAGRMAGYYKPDDIIRSARLAAAAAACDAGETTARKLRLKELGGAPHA